YLTSHISHPLRFPLPPRLNRLPHHLEHLVEADEAECALDAAFSLNVKYDPVPALRQPLAQRQQEAESGAVNVFHAPEIEQDRLVSLLQASIQMLFEPGH